MNERWLFLTVLTFARAAMGLQFQSVAAASPFLLDQFHFGYAGLGTLVGLYLFPGIAVALPGGILAQRAGDKRLLCIGLAAMSLGASLMTTSESFALLIAGRLVSGCGAAVVNVLVTKMVADRFQNRTLPMGILVTSWPLGISIALVALPALAQCFGWPAVTVTTAAVTGLACALVAIFCCASADDRSNRHRSIRSHCRPARDELRLAVLAGLVWTFYNAAIIVVLSFGPQMLIGPDHDAATASAIVSAASWVIIPALPLGGWLAEHIGRPNLTMIACFLSAALLIWLSAVLGMSTASLAVIGAMLGLPGGLVMSLPGNISGAERRALVMGVFFTCYYAGAGVLPALAGYARDLTGWTAVPMAVAGGMLIAAIVMLIVFCRIKSSALRQRRKPSGSTADPRGPTQPFSGYHGHVETRRVRSCRTIWLKAEMKKAVRTS